MNEIDRIAYEKWLAENNVPEYMRRLYDDDPIKIRDAIRRKKEQEARLKQAKKLEEQATAEQQAPKPNVYKLDEEPAQKENRPQLRTAPKQEEKPAKKQKKKAIKKKPTLNKKGIIRITVFSLVLVAIFVLLLNSLIKSKNKTEYEIGYISKGELLKNGNGNGYFVRDASSIEAPSDGVFVAKLEEGKKIEAGGVIGYITTSEHSGAVERLEVVKKNIVALQNLEEKTVTSGELYDAENAIKEKKNELEKISRTGNFTNYDKIVEELNELIVARDEILLATKSSNTSVTALQQEKEELETIISKKMVAIKSQEAGVVSYYVSGNEDIEKTIYADISKNKAKANFDDLEKFTGTKSETYSGQEVKAGQVICKVVNSQDYYIVVKTESEGAENLNGIVTMANTNKDYQAAGSIVSASKNLVIFSTMRSIKGSMPYEKMTLSFNISSESGYTVPITALTDWDKNNTTARLAIIRANRVKFVYVGIVAFDKDTVVISATPFKDSAVVDEDGNVIEAGEATFVSSDKYIINAESVKEGQTIED